MILLRLLFHHSGMAIGKTAIDTSISRNGIKLQNGRHDAGDGITRQIISQSENVSCSDEANAGAGSP